MVMRFKLSWVVLGLTSASLVLGLTFNSNLAYQIGAAAGLLLSIRMVWISFRTGEVGSDVLAIVSIVATGWISEWLAASIISVMLASGQALEAWASGNARGQLEALAQRAPRTVQLIDVNGQASEQPISKVRIGDTFLVRNGDVVGVDGTCQSAGAFDESALTGEPLPVEHEVGAEVPSGVVNVGNPVIMTATTTAEFSTYSALVRMVENAKAHVAPGVRLANRYALWFVPLSFLIAAAAWFATNDPKVAISVIVAATPCPLILAVPIAIIAGISSAAKRGAIIKDGGALERLAQSETLLVDKTGTLTHGGPEVTHVQVGAGWSEDEVLSLAAALEISSAHVLAKAVVRAVEARGLKPPKVGLVSEVLGEGISGILNNHNVGVSRLLEPLPDWVQVKVCIQICVTQDNLVVGVIDLEDPIRTEAVATISRLRSLGIKRILLVTGDRKPAADAVAAEVGVDEVFAESRPQDKLNLVVSEKQTTKGSVLVVGDGINDSPALAAADVGVAMGARGATAASESASVVIIEDSIERLADAVEVSKFARKRALQAAGIGMGLSLGAMIFGALGILGITENAIAQEIIDATAILWALLPNRRN